ncbi:MAG: AraC family transcriptional regulator [Deferrisomatales bacterium]|nr:AraC family transcriptional regulator [Deferrisomatales bacterium]
MRRGQDIAVEFPGLYLVHQNLPARRVRRHRRQEHLIFIPLQGEICVNLGQSSLRCGPGRMVYLPPATEHAFDSTGVQGERLIALIHDSRWVRTGATPAPAATLFPASQLCKELLFYLLLHPHTGAADPILDVLIQTWCESLDAAQGSLQVEHLEGKCRDPRARSALAYLRRNLERKVRIGEAAAHAGLSARTLHRLFLREVGLPPRRILSLLRVSKARDLLASGNCTVTEAAWEVGYDSLSQFIAVFRQVTGQLPSEFARFGSRGAPT